MRAVEAIYKYASEITDYQLEWTTEKQSFIEHISISPVEQAKITLVQNGDHIGMSMPLLQLKDNSSKDCILSHFLEVNTDSNQFLFYGLSGAMLYIRANFVVSGDIEANITNYLAIRHQFITNLQGLERELALVLARCVETHEMVRSNA